MSSTQNLLKQAYNFHQEQLGHLPIEEEIKGSPLDDIQSLSYIDGFDQNCIIDQSRSFWNCTSQTSTPQTIKADKKQIQRSKTYGRIDNTLSSNSVRLLKQCIKQIFRFQPQIYNKFLEYFSFYEIKCQLWSFDAILMYILYLRDQTGQLSQNLFMILKHSINIKLANVFVKVHNIFLKQRLTIYRNYYEQFLKQGKLFSSYDQLKQLRLSFFESLVVKKKSTVIKCMSMLQNIQEQLMNGTHVKKFAIKIEINENNRKEQLVKQ